MKKLTHVFYSIALLLAVSACSNNNYHGSNFKESKNFDVPVNRELFLEDDKEINIQKDIFMLSLPQQTSFLSEISKKQDQGFKLHEALEAVLSSKLSNFTYYGKTYNAEKTMRLNSGNCMSLAILTTAYAKLLGLDFSYRKVNTIPVFQRENNLILSSSHVQTIIYDADFIEDPNEIYIQKPGVVIDYFPDTNNRVGMSFGESTFTSMYYRNLAAGALVDNELAKAFTLAEIAHDFDQRNVEAINLLAVIHRRAGDDFSAEMIYQAGFEIEKSSLALMSNYIMLLRKQKRYEEASIYQNKLDDLDDPNPYHWLEQAYMAEKYQRTNKAVYYYQKALKSAPYLNQAYMGLYKIFREKGHILKAKSMLSKALEWTYEIEQRKQYKQKLYSLAQL
jgi:Tfp pilus assembly protein PilF